MRGRKTAQISHLEILEKRLRNPIPGLNKGRSELGLSAVAGTHGMSLKATQRLISEGRFSGGDPALQGTFHITPNLQFKGWKTTEFLPDVVHTLGRTGMVNPVMISVEYARCQEREEQAQDENTEALRGGVVISFGAGVLDSVRTVDLDDSSLEPEVVLREAPRIESIIGIHPVDVFAYETLLSAIYRANE